MIWGKQPQEGEPGKDAAAAEPAAGAAAHDWFTPKSQTSGDDPEPVSVPPLRADAPEPTMVPAFPFHTPDSPSDPEPATAGRTGFPAVPSGYPVSGTAYQAYPSYLPYAAAGWTPPPPRQSAGRWLFAIMCVLLALVVMASAGLVAFASYTGLLDKEGRWAGVAQEKAPTGTQARPEESAKAPPAANAPASEWQSWVTSRGFDILANRTRALAANREGDFIADVDPQVRALQTEQKRRFRGLRDLGTVNFRERMVGTPKAKGKNSWTADLEIEYCVVDPNCLGAPKLRTTSTWTFRSGRLFLSAIAASTDEWNGPRPWESNDLVVRKGTRVVVATTQAYASRLTGAVRAADRAAIVADTFAGFTVKAPARYTIYLAGPNEWKKWYGGTGENWAAARAWPISEYHSDVVIRADSVRSSELENLLRHELTHVTSLAGADLDGDSKNWWWLLEGIAEYASYRGKPVSDYDAITPVRRFVNNRDEWDGHVTVEPPGESASLDDAAARYGIAFLCVRRISDKYGEVKMLKFFNGVMQQEKKLDEASKLALGPAWSTVDSDCATYIRNTVN